MKVRRPTQAGAFYPATKDSLVNEIERCFLHELGPGSIITPDEHGARRIVSLVCPHAGYAYSGPIAAHSYFNLAKDGIPSSIVIIGPNHWGLGSGISIMTEGQWQTPIGTLSIDTEIAKQIVDHSSIIDVDETAHLKEHAIEVQLPFLQYLYNSKIRIVPISMMMQDAESCKEVGVAISGALEGKNAVIIASTDMTHYEPQAIAERKDKQVANAIAELDEISLQRIVEDNRISMCGYGPATTSIVAAKKLGAKTARILCYKTSGDVAGDYSEVVGYLSAMIIR